MTQVLSFCLITCGDRCAACLKTLFVAQKSACTARHSLSFESFDVRHGERGFSFLGATV